MNKEIKINNIKKSEITGFKELMEMKNNINYLKHCKKKYNLENYIIISAKLDILWPFCAEVYNEYFDEDDKSLTMDLYDMYSSYTYRYEIQFEEINDIEAAMEAEER